MILDSPGIAPARHLPTSTNSLKPYSLFSDQRMFLKSEIVVRGIIGSVVSAAALQPGQGRASDQCRDGMNVSRFAVPARTRVGKTFVCAM